VKYDRYAAFIMGPEYRLTARKIRRSGYSGGPLLDIGTGSGRLVSSLARQSGLSPIIGLDISADMLKLAHRSWGDRAAWVQATGSGLPFADESFEAVVSYASLHHWRQPVQVFNEIWRVTRPNGLILVRDNRRMLDSLFYRCLVRMTSLFVPPDERGRWPKSIRASYTVPEVRDLLKQTQMRNYRIGKDMGGVDLYITARKS
jgi:ubiquinone/menaquinone biosynthesis C-methylase UbiE